MSVTLVVYAPSVRVVAEKAFPLNISLYELRGRIELVTGIPPSAQTLLLYAAWGGERPIGAPIGDSSGLSDDSPVLAVWSARPNSVIEVADSNPARSAWLEGDVDKFELSDAEYSKRGDTVRAFMQANRLGPYAPEAEAQKEEAEEHVDIPIGSRCSVGGTDFARRGTVRFVGPTNFAKGIWVGVEYDEPVGKNDGSVSGQRYFSTRPLYGGFVKPSLVEVGDFPEENIDEI